MSACPFVSFCVNWQCHFARQLSAVILQRHSLEPKEQPESKMPFSTLSLAVIRQAACLAILGHLAAASPAPTARFDHLQPREPVITPSPVEYEATQTYKNRRNIISDVASDVDSVLSGLGSDIPSYVASGVPNFFQNFPTGDSVVSSLGIQSSELAALPTNVGRSRHC